MSRTSHEPTPGGILLATFVLGAQKNADRLLLTCVERLQEGRVLVLPLHQLLRLCQIVCDLQALSPNLRRACCQQVPVLHITTQQLRDMPPRDPPDGGAACAATKPSARRVQTFRIHNRCGTIDKAALTRSAITTVDMHDERPLSPCRSSPPAPPCPCTPARRRSAAACQQAQCYRISGAQKSSVMCSRALPSTSLGTVHVQTLLAQVSAHPRLSEVGIQLEQLRHVSPQLLHRRDLLQLVVVHHPGQAPGDLRGIRPKWASALGSGAV